MSIYRRCLFLLIIISLMFASIVLIIGWLFACYGLIIWKAPHLKDEFDKVVPYQGFFGLILLVLGLIDLFYLWRTISLLQSSLIFGALQMLNMITKFVLWFVLSFGLITKYLLSPQETSTKDSSTDNQHNLKEETHEATQKVYNTLIMVQVPFGILSIILGLIGLIFNLIY